jgi:hypothetical protein
MAAMLLVCCLLVGVLKLQLPEGARQGFRFKIFFDFGLQQYAPYVSKRVKHIAWALCINANTSQGSTDREDRPTVLSTN